jgi:hypothetical protein
LEALEYNRHESTKKENSRIYKGVKLNIRKNRQFLCKQSGCGYSLSGQSFHVLITTMKAAGVEKIPVEISAVSSRV